MYEKSFTCLMTESLRKFFLEKSLGFFLVFRVFSGLEIRLLDLHQVNAFLNLKSCCLTISAHVCVKKIKTVENALYMNVERK